MFMYHLDSTNPGSTVNTPLIIGLSAGIGGAVVLVLGGVAFVKFILPKCVHALTDRSSAYLA